MTLLPLEKEAEKIQASEKPDDKNYGRGTILELGLLALCWLIFYESLAATFALMVPFFLRELYKYKNNCGNDKSERQTSNKYLFRDKASSLDFALRVSHFQSISWLLNAVNSNQPVFSRVCFFEMLQTNVLVADFHLTGSIIASRRSEVHLSFGKNVITF